MSRYELGYTPNNLKKLLNDNNLTHVEAYNAINKSRNAFEQYLRDVNDPRHSTMKLRDWLKLIEYTKTKNPE